VKATSEKANVTASPIIVLGISEASLERGIAIFRREFQVMIDR
jgi:hypothetical protein